VLESTQTPINLLNYSTTQPTTQTKMKKAICRFGSDCKNPYCSLAHPNKRKTKTRPVQTRSVQTRPVQTRPVQTVQTQPVQTVQTVQTQPVQTQRRWQRPNQTGFSILDQVNVAASPSILAQIKSESSSILEQIKSEASPSILAQINAATSPSILAQINAASKKGIPKQTVRPSWNSIAKRQSLTAEIEKITLDIACENANASKLFDEIICNKFDDVSILKEFIHNELEKWKACVPVDYSKMDWTEIREKMPEYYWADIVENELCFNALKSFVSGIYKIGMYGITIESLRKTLEKSF